MALLWAFVLLVYQVWMVASQSYPSCSVACISAAVPSACNSTDNVCICQQVDEASLLSCFASSCDCSDQQTAASTFDSNCASNGVQVDLNVACATDSSSTASSAGSTGSLSESSSQGSAPTSSIASSVSASISSSVAATTSDLSSTSASASSTYSASIAVASSSSSIPTSAQTSLVALVSSASNGLSTSTAVIVFTSGDSTIITLTTSTHYYTPTPFPTSSSTSSSPSASIINVTQGSLISHGLATGAKAGIGAGAGAAVVAAIIFSVWLFWFCRQRRHKTSIADSDRYDQSPSDCYNPSNSDRYNSGIVPGALVGTTMKEKRLSELASETPSQKPTFSWGPSSMADSSHHRTPSSEEDAFHQSVSAESGQHSPPIDPTAYQRPILGSDGCWQNKQELQGVVPVPNVASPASLSASVLDDGPPSPCLQKVQTRPIVPPGKWPPTSDVRLS